MVDASALDRLAEAKEALNGIVEHDKMRGKPLLIFANKQDYSGSIDEYQLSQQLDLNTILGEHRRLSRVVCEKYHVFFWGGGGGILFSICRDKPHPR